MMHGESVNTLTSASAISVARSLLGQDALVDIRIQYKRTRISRRWAVILRGRLDLTWRSRLAQCPISSFAKELVDEAGRRVVAERLKAKLIRSGVRAPHLEPHLLSIFEGLASTEQVSPSSPANRFLILHIL
jgi:hypothetical protein